MIQPAANSPKVSVPGPGAFPQAQPENGALPLDFTKLLAANLKGEPASAPAAVAAAQTAAANGKPATGKADGNAGGKLLPVVVPKAAAAAGKDGEEGAADDEVLASLSADEAPEKPEKQTPKNAAASQPAPLAVMVPVPQVVNATIQFRPDADAGAGAAAAPAVRTTAIDTDPRVSEGKVSSTQPTAANTAGRAKVPTATTATVAGARDAAPANPAPAAPANAGPAPAPLVLAQHSAASDAAVRSARNEAGVATQAVLSQRADQPLPARQNGPVPTASAKPDPAPAATVAQGAALAALDAALPGKAAPAAPASPADPAVPAQSDAPAKAAAPIRQAPAQPAQVAAAEPRPGHPGNDAAAANSAESKTVVARSEHGFEARRVVDTALRDGAPQPTILATHDPRPAPAAAPAVPAAAPAEQRPHDFATLVDKLVEARDAAAPHAVQASVSHAVFGQVSLNFHYDDGNLTVAMHSDDPGFAQAAHAAAAHGTGLADGGSASQRQDAPNQQSPGQSYGQAQPQSQQQAQSQGFAQGSARPQWRGEAGDRGGSSFSPGKSEQSPPAQRSGIYA